MQRTVIITPDGMKDNNTHYDWELERKWLKNATSSPLHLSCNPLIEHKYNKEFSNHFPPRFYKIMDSKALKGYNVNLSPTRVMTFIKP